MKVIKISNSNGVIPIIETINCIETPISEKFIKNNIGKSNGQSWIEVVYGKFEDMRRVIIICDEREKINALRPTLHLEKDYIAGNMLICVHTYSRVTEGHEIIPLTDIEAMQVLKKFKVFITI